MRITDKKQIKRATALVFGLALFIIQAFMAFEAAAESQKTELPRGWKEWHTTDGRIYYQKPDGTTTWTVPGSPDAPPPPPEEMRPQGVSGEKKDRTDRKGFVIGLDLGGGGGQIGDENMGALLGGNIIGGGITERILLLAESPFAVGFRSGAPSAYAILFAAQFFVTDEFFVRPGLGFGFATITVNNRLISSESGFAGALATGYELRLTKRFALSPEVKVIYLRAEGFNNFSIGVAADLRWYF